MGANSNPIDWDEVVEKAENSPRAVLAELLERADELKDIIVISLDGAGCTMDYSWPQSNEQLLWMLESTRFQVLARALGYRRNG